MNDRPRLQPAASTAPDRDGNGFPWRPAALLFGGLLAPIVVMSFVINGVALAKGNVHGTVNRTGTASDLACRPSIFALGLHWVCTAEQVRWDGVGTARLVRDQRTPYTVYAASDASGSGVRVIGHPPGNQDTKVKPEVIVVEGHPVGHKGWTAVAVFGPFAFAAAWFMLLAAVLKARAAPRRRRRS